MTSAADILTLAQIEAILVNFPRWLRQQMALRQLSQRQLAIRAHCDHSSISRILSEDRDVSAKLAVRLIRAAA